MPTGGPPRQRQSLISKKWHNFFFSPSWNFMIHKIFLQLPFSSRFECLTFLLMLTLVTLSKYLRKAKMWFYMFWGFILPSVLTTTSRTDRKRERLSEIDEKFILSHTHCMRSRHRTSIDSLAHEYHITVEIPRIYQCLLKSETHTLGDISAMISSFKLKWGSFLSLFSPFFFFCRLILWIQRWQSRFVIVCGIFQFQ